MVALPTAESPPVTVTVPDGLKDVVHAQFEEEFTCTAPNPPELGNTATSWLKVTDGLVKKEAMSELTLVPPLFPTTFQ
jgi:hypothetical protein